MTPLAVPLLALLGGAGAYAAGVRRLRGRGDAWPARRSLLLALGVGVLAVALLPPLAALDERFPVHAAQHVLLGALAPLLLVRAAPVTLALRGLPPPAGRRLLRLLHGPVVRTLVRAPVVLALHVGGAYALYLTPLFTAAEQHPPLHALVHLHVVAAGVLFAVYVAGLDPVPGRPGVRGRLVVLALAAAAHDVLCTTLYARGLPAGASPADVHTGAQVMYYGAGAVELLLAVVLLGDWWVRGSRELRHRQRRERAGSGPSTPQPLRDGHPEGLRTVRTAT